MTMSKHEDLSWIEELPPEEPSELLRTMPEMKHYLGPDPEEEPGLRSLLEHPDALSRAWWRDGKARKRRAKHGKRRPPDGLDAA